MKSTTTYLHFNGNCRTAMAFYRECFGGELEVMAYPNSAGEPNSELEKLFAALSLNGKVTVPPSDTPFRRFGMCNDSFGISWILNCAKAA
jgi:PhnB protein